MTSSSEFFEFTLYREGGVNLFYWRHETLRVMRSLRELGYTLFDFDTSTWENNEHLFDAINSALNLEDFSYTGRNITAFDDRLCQVDWPLRCALIFWNFEFFVQNEPKEAQWFLEVLTKHVGHNIFFGKRLLILLQSNDKKLRFAPLLRHSVTWSGRSPHTPFFLFSNPVYSDDRLL